MVSDDTDWNCTETPRGMESIPGHPLSMETVAKLLKHDRIETCFPVYRVSESDDSVVGLLLTTDDGARVLLFDMRDSTWKIVFESPLQESAYSQDAEEIRDALTTEMDVLDTYFPETDVEFIQPRDSPAFNPETDVVTQLLATLPDAPVTTDALRRLAREPDVESVVPQLFLEPIGDVLMFSTTVEPYDTTADAQFTLAYFDPGEESWCASTTVPVSELSHPGASDADDGIEDAIDDAYEVIRTQYPREQLREVTQEELQPSSPE